VLSIRNALGREHDGRCSRAPRGIPISCTTIRDARADPAAFQEATLTAVVSSTASCKR
jgi:hypothetical protein